MFGRTPLHYAADCGHSEAIRLMMEFGADTAVVDRQGKTPVDLATSDELKELMTTSMNISEVNFSLTDDTQDLDMMSRQGLHSAQRSEILSPINELSSAMPTSPEESNIFPAGVDFDDIMPDTFGKSRKSFEIVDNVKILDTAES